MRLELAGRACEVQADHGLEPEDSMFAKGYWVDTEEDLTDAELDELTHECGNELYELWLDHQQGRADWLLDADE